MKIKLKCKKLQKNEYIIYELKGRRTYLVYSKKRAKQIMKNYRKYGDTPFGRWFFCIDKKKGMVKESGNGKIKNNTVLIKIRE